MKDWWNAYIFTGDVEYLSLFKSLEDFESIIPVEHLLNLDKLTLAECVEWSKYNDEYGVWPTTAQCRMLKELRIWKVKDIAQALSCNTEEHF